MLTMRGAPPLLMTDDDRDRLAGIAGSPALAHRAVRQAEALLAAADRVNNEEIGRRVGVSANTVRAWRPSFAREGVAFVGVIAKGRGSKACLPEGKGGRGGSLHAERETR